MFKLVCVTVMMAICAASGFGGTIGYSSVSVGGAVEQYTYTLSGFPLLANQEIALLFDPSIYGALSNGVAGAEFDLLLLQPDNQTGTAGVYSALALVDNPSLLGPFSVQFVYLGSGLAGSQPYQINQYDSGGNFLATIATGTTVLNNPGPASVPEPAALVLTGLGLAAAGVVSGVRQRRGSGRAG